MDYYAKNNKPPLFLSTIKALVGSNNYPSNYQFIVQSNIGSIQDLRQETCDCGADATVKNVDQGIIVCTRNHVSHREVESLRQCTLDTKSIIKLFYEMITKYLHSISTDSSEARFASYLSCGLEPIAESEIDSLKILFLTAFKRIRIRDAAALQGLITNTSFDSFALIVEGIDDDAQEFLSYSSGGIVQLVKFDEVLGRDKDRERAFDNLRSGINFDVVKLHSFLKYELKGVEKVTSPEMFLSLIQYNDALVDRSFKDATQGKSEDFEDDVSNLLASILSVKQLGHTIGALTEGKKIEIPDGILEIEILKKGNDKLELMFYDCKSTGKPNNEKEIKRISQSDEDQFERYCRLFSSPKMSANLTGGIIVANDFSGENLVNKARQIRGKGQVPRSVKIVFLPLRSLVRLYTRTTKERRDFTAHFESEVIYQLFAENLSANAEKKLVKDPDFETFDTLRKSNTNSVYVLESLVDVFFDTVLSLPTREASYLPFVIDISHRYSSEYS